MNGQGLANDGFNGHARIQGRKRVLKNNLHVAANFAKRIAAHGANVLTIELDFTRTGFDQTQNASAGGGLAATRLAHHAQGFACIDVKAHTINGMNAIDLAAKNATFDWEVFGQTFDFQQRH